MMDFATYLPARLRELGITQAELSRQLHVSNSAVSNWTRGMRPRGRQRLQAIATALDADYAEVVGLVNGPLERHQPVTGQVGATEEIDRGALRQRLTGALESMPRETLAQLVDYAEYLGMKQFRADWRRLAFAQLAGAYGEDEPDYTLADLKPFP